MTWHGITGSWRATSQEVERDVRQAVKTIIQNGDGIVTGGALNVDWFAVDEALQHDPSARQIKVIIPASLQRYGAHYEKRADEGVISHQQANQLISQLNSLKKANPKALIELEDGRPVGQDSYYDRNLKVVDLSDRLCAFQVNNSQGTQDTIYKAKAKGIPVVIKSYQI